MKGIHFLRKCERECYHSRQVSGKVWNCEWLLENCSVYLLPRSSSPVSSRRLEALRPKLGRQRDSKLLPFTWTRHPAMSSIHSTPIAHWAVLLTFYPVFFFFDDTATTEIYTLSLHDALPI